MVGLLVVRLSGISNDLGHDFELWVGWGGGGGGGGVVASART